MSSLHQSPQTEGNVPDPLVGSCLGGLATSIRAKHTERTAWIAKARAIKDDKRLARLAAGLKASLSPMEKLAERPTPMRAIAAKCWDCQGQDADPGLRWRIGNCEVGEACPLYHFRPHQRLLGAPLPPSMAECLGDQVAMVEP